MTMPKGHTLLTLARSAIAGHLNLPFDPRITNEIWLNKHRASFVSLHKNSALRGCIGSLAAHRPLIEDVTSNAVAAAFHDPRFTPLTADEFDMINIEVSLLSLPEKLLFANETELLDQLRPHIDGLILAYGNQRATFLPQVWAQLPKAQQFLAHLKQKAGLPPDFWHPDIEISRYTVEAFSETSKVA
ncbi:MAG: AmmeMemoRadiSam system protein A [Mariprofundaceae bacterium]